MDHLVEVDNLTFKRGDRIIYDEISLKVPKGKITAVMGPKAAMACTIAVEEVIGEHYQKQADRLGSDEASLKATIERFRDEELEHRDIAVDQKGREARHYKLLRDVIQTGCRTAIKIAEKI